MFGEIPRTLWTIPEPIKCQCCPHIEANQLTGFYMRATLACNGLNLLARSSSDF